MPPREAGAVPRSARLSLTSSMKQDRSVLDSTDTVHRIRIRRALHDRATGKRS